ncbi:secreted antigen 3 [Babesia divergens]|uniref:Secreted antigen 3 n=1 Tax=Babesia divergens TaxID=32595 RepID=A0AAD9GCI0_BABDI|nr:secreted antigen 3 [Babesia divergens]
MNFYKDVLKPEDFDVYAIWLEKNIQNIIKSYKKMLEESVELTEKELKTETSVGPLKYGFVYNGYWWGEIVYWLPPEVYADTGFLESLNELKTSLDKIPKSPVETSTVDYQINEDDVEESYSADVSDIPGNLDGSPVEPQVVEDAIEESSKVNESDIAENLKESTVEPQVAEKPKESIVESSPESSAPVPKSNLVFESSEWDDSMLASAFLFVREFCRDVRGGTFNAHIPAEKIKKLSKACEYVSSYVNSFTHRLKPTYGTATERREILESMYENVLKPEDFKLYAEWLVNNMPAIEKSVRQMYEEHVKCSRKQLNEFSSYGPRKYGFVYTGYDWGELTHGVNRGFFKDSTISQSFNDLKSSLEKVLKSFPKNSTVKSQAV